MNANYNYSPLYQQLLDRPHLVKKLKVSTQHKLTLIIAPPGYGKTTLVSQFVQSSDMPTAWQTLDLQDQDLPNLFDHALEALAQIAPEISSIKPVDGITPGELAIALTDYLQTHLKTEFLYVIDDVHYLLEAPDAKVWLRTLISKIPSNCHLILMGRAFPPLNLIDLFAHQKVLTLGQEILGFDREETIQLAQLIGSNLTPVEIEKVFSRMNGWPAGTLLALQPLPGDIETLLFDGKKAPEALFDSLADRLFHTQSFTLQSFLLNSSTLFRMTPALCQEVLHLSGSLENLNEALSRSLFINEVPGGVVYHSLFRDYLQRQLQRENPKQFLQLHTEAGKWFENENRLDEAFEHYIAAEQWEEAINIAERSCHIYIGQGRLETLLRWERALIHLTIKAPRFFHMCAMIHRYRYEYDLASVDADAAEAGFRANDNTSGLIQIILLRATMDNQRGYLREATERAAPYANDMGIPSNLRGYALAIMGTAALHLNELDKALILLETALPLYRDTGDQYAIADHLMTLEVTYFRLGRFEDAARCGEEVIAIRRAFGEKISIVLALNNLGYRYHLMGEYQKALQIFQEGLQITSRIPEYRADTFMFLTMGDLHRDKGAFHEAEQWYQKALQRVDEGEPFLKASILISLATLRRWQGEVDEAQKIASKARLLTEKHNLNWENQRVQLILDALGVTRGELKTVRNHLEAVIDLWQRYPAPQLTSALGIYAYGALLAGDEQKTHHLLKLAISKAQHVENLQPLFAEIIHTPLLKAFVDKYANRYAVLSSGVKRLEKAQVVLDSPTADAHTTSTYSLHVSVLGHESIKRDGVVVPKSSWQALSARKLFYYLLFNGPSSREDIGLSLWPESDSQQVSGNFHMTLSRARRAIGSNTIIFDNDLYSINPNIDLWCDVFEFKAIVQETQLSSPLQVHTQSQWYRAIKLYQGDFLVNYDENWITVYRESLLQMYLNSLVCLGKCLATLGKPREGIEILKQALKIDPYFEEAHRAILNCYHLLGERSFIIQHVNDLTDLLDSELGITPSPETIHLTQKLLG